MGAHRFDRSGWSEYKPKTWAVIEAHVTWVSKGGFSRLDEPQLIQIAEKHGLATETVQRYRREFPDYIAIAVLRSRLKFELVGPDEKYPAV